MKKTKSVTRTGRRSADVLRSFEDRRLPSPAFQFFCFCLRLRARRCWRRAGSAPGCAWSLAPSFCSQWWGCSRSGPSSSTGSKTAFRNGMQRAARRRHHRARKCNLAEAFERASASRSLTAVGRACSPWPSWPVPIQMRGSSTRAGMRVFSATAYAKPISCIRLLKVLASRANAFSLKRNHVIRLKTRLLQS